jgi:hypothetical protein
MLAHIRPAIKLIRCSIRPRIFPILNKLFHPLRARSNNHLRYTLSSKCLAVHECLSLDTRQQIQHSRDKKHNCGREEGGGVTCYQREPLHNRHDTVHRSARVVGLKTADEVVEFGRGRTDSQEQRDFDEEDDEGADTVGWSILLLP